MSDVKISALPASGALAAGDLFAVVNGGITSKCTLAQIQTGLTGAFVLKAGDVMTGGLAIGTGSIGLTQLGILRLATDTTALGLAYLEQASADSDPFDLIFRKARGTTSAPTVITTGDCCGIINFTGYSGAAGYVTGASIRGDSTGTIASTRVPANLVFSTGTNAAPTVLTDAMTINSSQNVGIGTSGPLVNLHVFSSTASATVRVETTFATSSAAFTAVGETANNFYVLRHTNSGTANTNLTTVPLAAVFFSGTLDTGGINFVSQASAPIIFANGGLNFTNERMRIASTGFVGISTTTPLTKLNVVDTISTSPRGILSSQFSTDTSGARVGFSKARGTEAAPTTIVTGDTLGRLMFRGYDGANFLEMASIEAVSTGTIAATRVPTNLIFATATDATPSVLTTRWTINNTGELIGASGANLTLATAALFSVTSGANQRAGNATLVGGTVTVANTTVTANTIVLLTRKSSGGTIGTAITYTLSAGASFTINSDSVIDTSTFSYILIEVP